MKYRNNINLPRFQINWEHTNPSQEKDLKDNEALLIALIDPIYQPDRTGDQKDVDGILNWEIIMPNTYVVIMDNGDVAGGIQSFEMAQSEDKLIEILMDHLCANSVTLSTFTNTYSPTIPTNVEFTYVDGDDEECAGECSVSEVPIY